MIRQFEMQPSRRMERRQIVERHDVGGLVGFLEIDRLDAKQREVTLGFLGRTNLTGNRNARLETESANLAGTDVDVVRARQVVVIRTAEEAEPVGKDFKRSFAVHQTI